MVTLLDVNVLIALFDPAHVHHDAAHEWFGAHAIEGWATCPLTENAAVRILSNHAYPGRRTTMADIVVRLQQLCASPAHTFWPDEVSLLDPAVVIFRHVQGPRQLTDIYLLTLAVHRRGRLVTFDAGITVEAVAGARRANLVVIGFEAPIA